MTTLRIQQPEVDEVHIELDTLKSYSIGRKKCDILLDQEPLASRHHATLKFDGTSWKIIDEMSANGTWLKGESVNYSKVESGDVIRIGKTNMILLADETAESANLGPEPTPRLTPAAAPKPRKPGAATMAAKGAPASKESIPVGAVVGVAIVLVVLVGGFVALSQGGAADKVEAEESFAEEQQSKASKASFEANKAFSEALNRALAYDDVNERLDALLAMEHFKSEDIISTSIEKFDRELLLANNKIKNAGQLTFIGEIQKGEKALAQGRLNDAYSIATDVRIDLSDAADELDQDAVAGLERRIEALANDAVNESQLLIQRMEHDADISVSLGWNSDAARIYRSIFDQAYVSASDSKRINQKLARASRTPDREVRRRAATVRGQGSIVATYIKPSEMKRLRNPEHNPEHRSEVGAEEVSAAGGSKTSGSEGSANEETPNSEPEASAALLKLFPEGERSENMYLVKLFGAFEAARAAKPDERLTVKLEGDWYVVQAFETAGVTIRHRRDEPVQRGWLDIPATAYNEWLEELDARGRDALIGLTIMSLLQDDVELASYLMAETYALENELKPSLDAWLARERRMDIPDGGFVIYKERLISPGEREAIETRARIVELVKTLEKGLKGRSKRRIEASDEAFKELLTLGDDAVKPTVEVLDEFRADLLEDVVGSTGLSRDTRVLQDLKKELDERRQRAKALIFNTQRWPYPYGPNNAEVTREVMELVAAVREVWETPYKVAGKKNRRIEETVEKLRRVAGMLEEIDRFQKHHESSLREDLDYLEAVANQDIDIQNYAVSAGDRKVIATCKEILKWNREIEEQYKGDPKTPTDDAWRQLEVTNDYRIMMGELPLKMNFKLFWAAQHHSQWCIEHNGGRISHPSPGGPRGEDPQQRARHEDYGASVSENIHMNGAGPSPQSAHDSWLSSSGHHRNILNRRWTVMGNGRYSTIWTQVFAASDEGDANTESKGGAM